MMKRFFLLAALFGCTNAIAQPVFNYEINHQQVSSAQADHRIKIVYSSPVVTGASHTITFRNESKAPI